MVLVDDQLPIDQHGRAGGPEFILKRTERLLPEEISRQVIAEEAIAAEEGVDPLAVAGRGCRRRAAGGMERLNLLGRRFAAPADGSRFAIQGNREEPSRPC